MIEEKELCGDNNKYEHQRVEVKIMNERTNARRIIVMNIRKDQVDKGRYSSFVEPID